MLGETGPALGAGTSTGPLPRQGLPAGGQAHQDVAAKAHHIIKTPVLSNGVEMRTGNHSVQQMTEQIYLCAEQ